MNKKKQIKITKKESDQKNTVKNLQYEDTKKNCNLSDLALFDLVEKLESEQEKNLKLIQHNLIIQKKIENCLLDNQKLECVLDRIHSKVSYRIIRCAKDLLRNTQQVVQKIVQPEIDELKAKIVDPQSTTVNFNDYPTWYQKYGLNSDKQLNSIRAEINGWQELPKIAVLMPVYNPSRSCLVNAIESVLKQVYKNFELCIADDASTEDYVKEILKTYGEKDSRIKIIYRKQNGHISEASNSALALVEAEYVALMDHDDLLTIDALYWVAKTIIQNPSVKLIYSDEDKMDLQGNHYAPYFKPDWNPELFLSHNFICHLGVYNTETVRAIGGFDTSFDGAQDYNLALRYIESICAEDIIHIPRILYHWRAVAGSTANGVHEKPYSEAKIVKAVTSALAVKHRMADVESHAKLPGALRVKYHLPEQLPLVSIIIPTRNGYRLLRRCIDSIIDKTNYKNYEILIVDNGTDDFVTQRYLQAIHESDRITVVRDDSPFNYASLNNQAAKQVSGDILAFLNNDLEVIDDNWLGEMVSHVVHSEVGAVGAKLYYPNDTIQHAGVIVGLGGVAGHSHKHYPKDHPGFCGRLLLTQNLSAVTAACMAIRKEVFNEVGGFDAKNLSVAFNDVDLCLRIKEQGYSIVWTPYAQMYHYESATRGNDDTPEKQLRFKDEIAYMKNRWGDKLQMDTAYNPNLTLDREDFSFAWPPQVWDVK